MRRLSIIDLVGGEQPIRSERTGALIVFNGELYNNAELRAELERAGHRFVSDHSDTETVLRAYEEWGSSCVTHLVGMFAFAIVDARAHVMYLARDRLGIKPLYYHEAPGRFSFASELKALFQDSRLERAADTAVLYRFLLHRVHDAGKDTFFAGVKRLLPGHFMTVTADGKTKTTKYWSPEVNPEFSSSLSDAEYAGRFGELFERVIRRHMIADVPVGVSLSGGLDSSGVSSVMAALMGSGADTHTQGSLHTFSALYPGQSIDESEYVHSVERLVRSVPHYAYPSVDQFWDEIAEWVWYQEEPTISSAPYAYYSVYRIAKGEVKVILSGNGGDELLAGYLPYFRTYLTSATDQHHFLAAVREVMLGRDLYKNYAHELVATHRPGAQRPFSMPDFLTATPADARRVRLPPEPQLEHPARRRRVALLDAQPAALRGQELNGLLDRVPGPLPRPRARRVHLPAADRPEDQEGMEPLRVPSGHERKDARGQPDEAFEDRLHEPGGVMDSRAGAADQGGLLLREPVLAGDLRLGSPRPRARRVARGQAGRRARILARARHRALAAPLCRLAGERAMTPAAKSELS